MDGIIDFTKRYLLAPALLIVTLYAAILSILTFYIKDKPQINYKIINEVNVFDLKKPLEGLSILFEGENLRKNNLNLKVITIEIQNVGNIDITENMYANKCNWGLQIKNADILQARVLKTTDTYLDDFFKIHQVDKNTLNFSKVIFETQKKITLEFLVIHKKDKVPNVKAFGKIVGLDNKSFEEIKTSEFLNNSVAKGFWFQLIEGNIFVHLLRFLMYIVIFIVSLVLISLIITSIIKIYTCIGEKHRELKAKKLKQLRNDPSINEKALNLFIKLYIEEDLTYLKNINYILTNKKVLNNIFKNLLERIKEQNKELEEKETNEVLEDDEETNLQKMYFGEIAQDRRYTRITIIEPKDKAILNDLNAVNITYFNAQNIVIMLKKEKICTFKDGEVHINKSYVEVLLKILQLLN
ncbi:MAG: hypothetical protein AB7V50_09530 [Vampirovibrionia bacterium]